MNAPFLFYPEERVAGCLHRPSWGCTKFHVLCMGLFVCFLKLNLAALPSGRMDSICLTQTLGGTLLSLWICHYFCEPQGHSHGRKLGLSFPYLSPNLRACWVAIKQKMLQKGIDVVLCRALCFKKKQIPLGRQYTFHALKKKVAEFSFNICCSWAKLAYLI